MADEGRLGELRQHGVKAVIAAVVGLKLEVQKDGHPVGTCEFIELLTGGRIALHIELLLANDAGSLLEPFFDLRRRGFEVRNLIRPPKIGLGIGIRHPLAPGGVTTAGCKAIGPAFVGRRAVHRRAGRQQNAFRDPHDLLMQDQMLV